MTDQTEKDYLEGIIIPLVSNPDDVQIERTTDERGIFLLVRLHKADMGKIIGMQGETVGAIRKLLRAYGMANNAHISVKIDEPV